MLIHHSQLKSLILGSTDLALFCPEGHTHLTWEVGFAALGPGLSMAVGAALGPLQVGPGCFWLPHPSVFISGGFCSLFLCRLHDHLPIILWLPTLLLSENSTDPDTDLNQTWIKIWVPPITLGPQHWPSKSFPQCFSSCLHLSLWLGSRGLSLLAPIH